MEKRTFTVRELEQVGDALEELAIHGQEGALELRRDGQFTFQGQSHPAVMGVYLSGSRTAVLYDAAFAGPGLDQPLAPPESVRAVLAASLLARAGVRRRWLEVIRAPQTAAPAAVILEAGAITKLLLDAEAGKGLQLAALGAEAAFALGHCFAATRPAWLKAYRPDLAAFFQSLLPPGRAVMRLTAPSFNPWATPIRC